MGLLDVEDIKYEKSILISLVQKYFPDFRRTLHELQRYTSTGELEISSLGSLGSGNIAELISYMKDGDFRKMRTWAALNSSNDMSSIYRGLYDELPKVLIPKTIPPLIILLAEYQYKSNFVVDAEINLVACLSEIMGECSFL